MITAERLQHDRITRDTERLAHDGINRDSTTIRDTHGGIGLPWRVESLLARLERRSEISPGQHAAGDEFHRLFQRACLDPLKAADVLRDSPGSVGPHGSVFARRRVAAALDALGGISSPCGSCAWFVLGADLSLNQWARREGWANRPIRHDVAKGTLVGALGVLAGHFGT